MTPERTVCPYCSRQSCWLNAMAPGVGLSATEMHEIQERAFYEELAHNPALQEIVRRIVLDKLGLG